MGCGTSTQPATDPSDGSDAIAAASSRSECSDPADHQVELAIAFWESAGDKLDIAEEQKQELVKAYQNLQQMYQKNALHVQSLFEKMLG